MADQINDAGARNNQLVEGYNEDVAVFNNRFGGTREFTQGDYQGDHINVYQFRDRAELILVLAHELGHALQLEHVDNQASIMFYLMGEQPPQPRLSAEDIEAFTLSCE